MDLATADDVKCLLSDAMPSAIGAPLCLPLLQPSSTYPPISHLQSASLDAAAAVAATAAVVSTDGPRIEGQGRAEEEDTLNQPALPQSTTTQAASLSQNQQQVHPQQQTGSQTTPAMTTASFLTSLGLDHLVELFDKEQVSVHSSELILPHTPSVEMPYLS